jgi:hypothetical protein
MYWAWSQGKDGKDYRETAANAADAGTLAHRMVECDLRGIPFSVEEWYERETIRKAQSAFEAYKSWKKQTNLKVKSLEIPFTSAEFMYGGTPDGIIEVQTGNLIEGERPQGAQDPGVQDRDHGPQNQ